MTSRSEVLSLLSEYPLLVPTNSYKKWEGYITVNDRQVLATINVPNYPSLNEISWEVDPQLEKGLLSQKDNLIKSKSLLQFLKSLECIFHNITEKSGIQGSVISIATWNEQCVSFYKQLLTDLEKSLQSCYIEEIGRDFKWVRIGFNDSQCNVHTVTLSFKINEQKADFEIIHHELPTDAVSVLSQASSLSQFFVKLEEVIELLIPFWDMCKNLEEKTWVMDPEHPKMCDVHRRIYVTEDLSVLLKFNPLDIASLPDIKFLGSINAVNKARDRFQNCLDIFDGWDGDLTVLENLERLLEVTHFPNKESVEAERQRLGTSSDCLICYTSHSEQPVKYCVNEKCSALFHLTCLLKWFETKQTSAAGSNNDYIRGKCPCCENTLYCPRSHFTLS